MKKNWILALILVLTLLLSACGTPGTPKETSAPAQTLPQGIMQTADPAGDDIINVLMIGNSYCYSYSDELYGIAKAAGVEMRICNVYYSGCSIAQHWSWWQSGKGCYEYATYDANGRVSEGTPREGEGVTLEYCLQQQNWDFISFHEAVGTVRTDPDTAAAAMNVSLRELLDYVNTQYPLTKVLWQQTWAFQVGFEQSGYMVTNAEVQNKLHENIRKMSMTVCEKFSLQRVPSGDAWKLAREHSLIGDTLCERLSGTDYHHEGDVGGGQYLNACVWFEVITGKSCVGNPYRPDYNLSAEKVEVLQQMAHQAVENMKAGN